MYNIIYTHSYYVFGYKWSVFSKYVLYKWNFVHEKCEVMEGIMFSGCFSIYMPKPASQCVTSWLKALTKPRSSTFVAFNCTYWIN